MILGKDWLDNFRPMWVHWKCQILCFTLQGRRITLHGVKAITSVCKKVIATKLQGMLRRGALTHVVQIYEGKEATICALDEAVDPETVSSTLPGPIASLLEEYQHLFGEPKSLPPRRAQDHQIPLLPGAQPVKTRPYRYTPQQKDEIEHQVYDMLCSGIIQRSSSPFASPVLLVRKKDG